MDGQAHALEGKGLPLNERGGWGSGGGEGDT
jgi:hypothetical protein